MSCEVCLLKLLGNLCLCHCRINVVNVTTTLLLMGSGGRRDGVEGGGSGGGWRGVDGGWIRTMSSYVSFSTKFYMVMQSNSCWYVEMVQRGTHGYKQEWFCFSLFITLFAAELLFLCKR